MPTNSDDTNPDAGGLPNSASDHEEPEWAKVEAGYEYVQTMIPTADDKVRLLWHGWALREAFIAGAEWQEKRTRPPTTPDRQGDRE
jgi:hypothetical protein